MGRAGRRVEAIVLVAGAALVGAVLWVSGAAGRVDDRLFDRAMRFNRATAVAPVQDDVVVVGIDEAFLEGVDEPLALSHAYIARFLGVLEGARPAAVGLDVILPEKRFDTLAPVADPDTDYHRILAAGLLRAVASYPVVVAKAWDADRGRYRDVQLDYVAILEGQGGRFSPQGSALLCPDPDDVIRRYPGRACQPDRSNTTLASELAAAAGHRAEGTGYIDYRRGGEFQYVPLREVFDLDSAGNTARLAQLFRGRIVLLGAILDETDLVRLPMPMAEWRPGNAVVPGVLVHAQMARNMLQETFVRPVHGGLVVALALIAGLLVAFGSARTAVILWGVVMAGLAAASVLALRSGWWILPFVPAVVASLVLIGRLVRAGHARRLHRASVHAAFGGQVDPGVVQRIADGTLPGPETGARHVALLDCLLRLPGTPDERDLAAFSRQLGALLDDVTDAIHRHGGTLDSVSGTRVTAFFGALPRLQCPEKNAMEAAADIVLCIASRTFDGGAPHVTVALHADREVTALLSTSTRERYTLLGDGFRATAELLAAHPDGVIVCSAPVARGLGEPAFLSPLGLDAFAWDPRRAARSAETSTGVPA